MQLVSILTGDLESLLLFSAGIGRSRIALTRDATGRLRRRTYATFCRLCMD